MAVLTAAMNSSLGPAVCRVCLCGETSIPYLGNAPGEPLISPCHCKGTMGLYHRSCLEHWLSISRTYCCEICKFRFEVGRRKQGFVSYLRAHSWFIRGEHARSVGGDCACLLILTPLTLGGSVLCVQSINERLHFVDQNGDFERAHEILGLGLMAFFLIAVFCFWVLFTVLFYIHDFRIWQKKNVILYVIDQLDREDEQYSRSMNRLSESQRPLLLRKKLRRFICCCRSEESAVIPLRDAVADINPQLVQPYSHHDLTQQRLSPFTIQHADRRRSSSSSPINPPTHRTECLASGSRSAPHTSARLAVLDPVSLHVPSLSTFRPQATSEQLLPTVSSSAVFRFSPSISPIRQPDGRDVHSPIATSEPTYSVPPDATHRQPVGFTRLAVSPQFTNDDIVREFESHL